MKNPSRLKAKLLNIIDFIASNQDIFLPLEKSEALINHVPISIQKGTITRYNQGVQGINWNQQSHIQMSWGYLDKPKYINRVINNPHLRKLTSEVEQELEKNELNSEIAEKIVKLIEYICLSIQLGINQKKEIADKFYNDLVYDYVPTKIKTGVKGVWIHQSDQIKINDFVTIRRPSDDDFIIETRYNEMPTSPVFSQYKHLCSAIIEIHIDAPKDVSERNRMLNEYLFRIPLLLSLFDLGGVKACWAEFPSSSVVHRNTLFYNKDYDTPHQYKFESTHAPEIQSFFKIMTTLVPNASWRDNPSKKNDSLYLTILRYHDAITHGKNLEHRITNVMFGLEASLLSKSDKFELSHRLAQRSALISKLFSCNPLTIFKKVKECYSYRSRIVHGAIIRRDDRRVLSDLISEITALLRTVILTFASFTKAGFKQEEFLKILDEALLCETRQQELLSVVKKSEILKSTRLNTGFDIEQFK